MQSYDPFHRRKMVTKVFYFSGSGHTQEIADYCAQALNVDVISFDKDKFQVCDVAIVVFPVYCQNIPQIVRDGLPKIDAKRFVLIATYGRISFGNVLHEASQLINGTMVAAAYVPTGHSYLSEGNIFDLNLLHPIFANLSSERSISIKRFKKNIFADFLPDFRSRIGVKIKCSEDCNKCGICTRNCPCQAMHNGTPDNKCIRCLRCVKNCPQQALSFHLNPFMKWYLRKPKEKRFLLFLE